MSPAATPRLTITAEARVEFNAPRQIPDRLDGDALGRDRRPGPRSSTTGRCWIPGQFARPTALLEALRDEMDLRTPRRPPGTTLIGLNHHLYDHFAYVPRSTRVDSPIDEALEARQGVCQDLSHIMTALVRGLGIPCRYVSGYLYHGDGTSDRSARSATHAWVEALLPGLGWVGFDPTNDLIAADRHIRVAIGRDYADVPPTRGVFTGDAKGEISVDVKVEPSQGPTLEDAPSNVWQALDPDEQASLLDASQAQQQQ